jgi:hypothetical protein
MRTGHLSGGAPTPWPHGHGVFISRPGGAPVESQSQKLFELLLARVAADGAPPYIGELASIASLPPGLPPVYAWLSHAGDLHIDTDRAALARICVLESIRAGQPVAFGSAEIERSVSKFCAIAAASWAAALIEQRAAVSELKSAKQRAALRWSAAR